MRMISRLDQSVTMRPSATKYRALMQPVLFPQTTTGHRRGPAWRSSCTHPKVQMRLWMGSGMHETRSCHLLPTAKPLGAVITLTRICSSLSYRECYLPQDTRRGNHRHRGSRPTYTFTLNEVSRQKQHPATKPLPNNNTKDCHARTSFGCPRFDSSPIQVSAESPR